MSNMGHNGNIKARVMFPKSTVGGCRGIFNATVEGL